MFLLLFNLIFIYPRHGVLAGLRNRRQLLRLWLFYNMTKEITWFKK